MSKSQKAVETRVIGTGMLENGHPFYAVTSSSHPEMVYVVEQWPTRLECLCKDRLYRRRTCKHIRCVEAHKAQLEQARADAEAEVEARGTAPPTKPPASSPAHGRYFGARSQEPFSFMR